MKKKNTWISPFYIHNILSIDYKNINILKKFTSIDGKILPIRKSGLSNKQHRKLARSIKRARNINLLPFINQDS